MEQVKESGHFNKVKEHRKDSLEAHSNSGTPTLQSCPAKAKNLITKGAVQRQKQKVVPVHENFLT